MFIIYASVQGLRFSSGHCTPIDLTRTAMFLFMTSVELSASRRVAEAVAGGAITKAVLFEAAPPGPGVR